MLTPPRDFSDEDLVAALVVAPLLTADGEPLVQVGRFAVAVYPLVTGESFARGS